MKIFEFLSKCRHFFNTQSQTHATGITFVIGNQSADLDSIISSISLAYYKYLKLNEISYLPVLNTTLDIIETKDECKYLFDYHKISSKDFIYLNELTNSTNDAIKFKNSKIFLVDHNKLDDFEVSLNFDKHISGIIDHHKDEGLFKENTCENKIRIVDNTIASNALLITELIKNDFCFKTDSIDTSLFTILLFAVLADTNNMSPERPRITDRDKMLFDYLIDKSGLNLSEANNLYNKINDLKVNSSNNKPIEVILQNDYKQWSVNKFDKTIKYGISSVLIQPKLWIEKDGLSGWLNEVNKYRERNNLDCLFILALYTDIEGKISRDLILFAEKNLCDLIPNYFQNEVKIHQILNMSQSSLQFMWMNTIDSKKTRKIWQPYIDEFLLWSIENAN